MASHIQNALAGETEKLLACVHCGLCLSSCPTYVQLGNENHSPRGRLYLMRAVAEGRIDVESEAFNEAVDLCLGCRACESVCPAGVHYGPILEAARAAQPGGGWERWILRHVFTSALLLKLFFAPARWLRGIGILGETRKDLPEKLRQAVSMLLATRPGAGRGRPARTGGAALQSAALFTGCVGRELFGHTNLATTRVLEENGCRVMEPEGQICCGALHAHSGELETARELARKTIAAFEKYPDVPVIVNAAGCGAILKEYGHLLPDDPRARAFSARVRDISEYLVEIGFEPGPRPVTAAVTYDAPCHLHHAQRVTKAPLELIRRIPGIDFRPLRESEVCCGSAGIYNLQHPELAGQILDRKLEHIRNSGAAIVLTGNPGCLMQIRSGAEAAGIDVQVMHPVELLAQTYE